MAQAHANQKVYICRKRRDCANKTCSYQREWNGTLFAPECADLEQVAGPDTPMSPREYLESAAIPPWIEHPTDLYLCLNRKREGWCNVANCRYKMPVVRGKNWPKCANLRKVGGPKREPEAKQETKEDLSKIIITCGNCGYVGAGNTYYPNLTSIQNACRCPKCHSTNNDYNAKWQKELSATQAKDKLLKSVESFLDQGAGVLITCPHCEHEGSKAVFTDPFKVNVPGYYFCPNCGHVFHGTSVRQAESLDAAREALQQRIADHVTRVLKEKDSLVAHFLRESGAKPWEVEIVEEQHNDIDGQHWITYIRKKEKPA